jgi:hypothetical protein
MHAPSGCFLDPITLVGGSGAQQWDEVQYQAVSNGASLAVKVRVRHERDPYLYFLDLSDGTLDFGLKRSEKVSP